MTNREKLMQMSDEDLAKLLCKAELDCTRCPAWAWCTTEHDKPIALMAWLREEADNDNV